MGKQRAIERLLIAPLCWDEIVDRGTVRTVPGGAGFYAAHALARLGARVVLHTPLAKADRSLLEHLPPGVDLVIHPSRSTTRFRLEIDPSRPDERRLLLRDRSDAFDSNRIRDSLVADSILLGPLLPGDLDRDLVSLLGSARRPIDLGIQGLVRSTDEGGSVLPMRPIDLPLPSIRILSGDEDEIATLTGLNDLDHALADLTGRTAEEVIATRANRGATILTRNAPEPVAIPAVPPEKPIRHTVGLGDTFLAVYSWHRSCGDSMADAGREAAEAASRLMEEGIDAP